jgi:hypothetical protein
VRDPLSGTRIREFDLNDARIAVHRAALTRFGESVRAAVGRLGHA